MAGRGLSAPLGACVEPYNASLSSSAMSACLFGAGEGGGEELTTAGRRKSGHVTGLGCHVANWRANRTDTYICDASI